MPAFIKFDGVDGETDAAHSEANWELTVKALDAGGVSAGSGHAWHEDFVIVGNNEHPSAGRDLTLMKWDNTTQHAAATGSPLPSVTDIIIDPFNPLRGTHAGGIDALLGDGSVRHGVVGNNGLIYSGESGGPFDGGGFDGGMFVAADDPRANENTYQGTTMIVDGVLGRDPPSAFDLM